jgi:predicted alpha/beta superfamily hydrolase/TolA-binding protein
VERCKLNALRQLREEKMRRFRIAFFLAFTFVALVSFRQGSCFAQQDGDDIVIGKYRTIHSHILNEDRLLFVHLPKEYEDTQLRFPVLYVLYVDLYDYFTEAVTTTEKLGGTGETPPMIVVGVANTNRYRDLLPFRTTSRPESGGGDNFLEFVGEELIPSIDRTYRTKPFRILAGPQTAAVFSLYALISKPKLFNAIVSENPFMNSESAEILYPRAVQFFKQTDSLKHLLYIKCEKDEQPQNLEWAERFAKLLESEHPQGFRFKVESSEPSGYFITPLPFRDGLRMLFVGCKLPPDFQTNSLQDILDYYKERSEVYGLEVDPPEHMLTFEGDKLRRRGKTREAVEVFEYQHRLYPKSLNALFQLGETFRGMGEFEKAGDFYRRFLEIRQTDAAMIYQRLNEIDRMIDSSATYRIEQEIKKRGIQAGLQKYQAIRSDPNSGLYFDESEMNALGYRMMGAGKLKDAIEVFKLNVELHPESANVYDGLGEAYLKIGDNERAVKNYSKSLELNPWNNNARETLKKLGKAQ